MGRWEAGMSYSKVLVGHTLLELQELMQRWDEPAYRARQLAHWLYFRPVPDINDMSNLPQALRNRLSQKFILHPCRMEAVRKSRDGTRKYLLALPDDELIEAVFIPESNRFTVCISTQAGCGMGCIFCATAQRGLARSLTVGEIVDQVLVVALETGKLPTNVVFMGMGEPLANYEPVVAALRLFNASWGLNIGMRRLTVSTCGLVPGIRRLARERLPITLAVSLHAPTDEKRNEIMPVNRRFPLSQLVPALHEYVDITGRRITVEYALMREFNDSPREAEQLVDLLKGLLCHVNLIPVNPVGESPYTPPSPERILHFRQILEQGGLPVSIRRERGTDIEAACGQLRGQRGGAKQ